MTDFPWGPTDVCDVWVHPETRTSHAVIGSNLHGYRLACQPNTPAPVTDADLLDYRCTGEGRRTCRRDACWAHATDPEGRNR